LRNIIKRRKFSQTFSSFFFLPIIIENGGVPLAIFIINQ
jgi:hypothetical protein